jgi:O-antigen ligase
MVLLVFFYATNDSERATWLFHRMVWLVILGNVVTVVDALNIPDLGLIDQREDGRVGGTIGNSNEYAAFLTYFLPPIAAIFLTSKGALRRVAGVGAALSALAFLMTVSRGGIVGLLVGGLIGAFYLRAFISTETVVRVGFGVLVLSMVVLAGGIAAGYGDLLLERFGLFGAGKYDATSGRTVIWGRALGSMFDHPVTFLTGFGWYAYESSRYFSFATHNAYLNILYNLGAIGVLLFLLTVGNILRVIRAAIHTADSEIGTMLKSVVFGLLALLVSITFGELYTSWLYVWAFAGVSLRLAAGDQ